MGDPTKPVPTGPTMGSIWASGAERASVDIAAVGRQAYVDPAFRPGLIRHVVLLRFAPTTAVADATEAERRFLALEELSKRADGTPCIRSIESGRQLSTETAGDGFDLGFIVTFASEGDRNFYLGRPVITDDGLFDPAHDDFKRFVGPLLDTAGVVAFDLRV